MKRMVVTVWLLIISLLSLAQELRDVVYLKNKSIIIGHITEQTPGVSLTIQTDNGSIFVLDMSEVEKKEQVREAKSDKKTDNYWDNVFSRTNKRYPSQSYWTIDGAHTFGIGKDAQERVELSLAYGLRFNPYFYIGAGGSIHYYYNNDSSYGETAMPVYINPRIYLTDGKISPFLDCRLGYSLLFSGIIGGYISLAGGADYAFRSNLHVFLSIGYSHQNSAESDYRGEFGGLTLRCGVSF